jgi:hypothetical protein
MSPSDTLRAALAMVSEYPSHHAIEWFWGMTNW